jgi:hypothetical protein
VNIDQMMTDAVAALDELWQDPAETAAEHRRLLRHMQEEEQLEEAVEAEPAHELSTSAAIVALGETLRESAASWDAAATRLAYELGQSRRAVEADAPERADRPAAVTHHSRADPIPSRLYLYPRIDDGWPPARAVRCSDVELPYLEGVDESNSSWRRPASSLLIDSARATLATSALSAFTPVGLHFEACPHCDHSSDPVSGPRPTRTYSDLIKWIEVRVPKRSSH